MNTGDLLEDSDEEHSFKILITAREIMLLFFALADEEKIYHPGGQKIFLALLMCISKTFIVRQYSPPVVFFDEVPLQLKTGYHRGVLRTLPYIYDEAFL